MTTELIARLRVRPQTEPFYRDGIYLDGRVPTVEALAADALEQQAATIQQKDERIAELTRTIGELNVSRSKTEATLRELQRGEFICKRCGLRKDGEHEQADF